MSAALGRARGSPKAVSARNAIHRASGSGRCEGRDHQRRGTNVTAVRKAVGHSRGRTMRTAATAHRESDAASPDAFSDRAKSESATAAR